jgi:uncharacterized membrane protein
MENVVTAIFNVESEAYQAFTQIRKQPFGEDYFVAEASLLKHEGDSIVVADAFDAAGITSDDTATGMIVGSLIGILGGPLGVLLGASAGALIGSAFDSDDAIDSASMLEVTAAKLYENEVAIVALVQEDEPAFDAAFEGYKTTVMRHYATDVLGEVDRARESQAEMENQLRQQLRAERKEERAEKREERKDKIQGKFDGIKAKREERKAEFDEGMEIANAQFTTSTKEMLGTE